MKSGYYILHRRVMKHIQKTFIVQINTTDINTTYWPTFTMKLLICMQNFLRNFNVENTPVIFNISKYQSACWEAGGFSHFPIVHLIHLIYSKPRNVSNCIRFKIFLQKYTFVLSLNYIIAKFKALLPTNALRIKT